MKYRWYNVEKYEYNPKHNLQDSMECKRINHEFVFGARKFHRRKLHRPKFSQKVSPGGEFTE